MLLDHPFEEVVDVFGHGDIGHHAKRRPPGFRVDGVGGGADMRLIARAQCDGCSLARELQSGRKSKPQAAGSYDCDAILQMEIQWFSPAEAIMGLSGGWCMSLLDFIIACQSPTRIKRPGVDWQTPGHYFAIS
jgi:hypothetical protein